MNCSYYTSPDDMGYYWDDDPEEENTEFFDDFSGYDEPEQDNGHYEDGVLL